MNFESNSEKKSFFFFVVVGGGGGVTGGRGRVLYLVNFDKESKSVFGGGVFCLVNFAGFSA